MADVQKIEPPEGSFIAGVQAQAQVFADSFAVPCSGAPTLAQLLTAFYGSWVFWPERVLMGVLWRGSTSKAALEALAGGFGDRFGAWRVVQRSENEILLRDKRGATASWMAVVAGQVMFGSVLYTQDRDTVKKSVLWRALTAFHTLFSRMLLAAAARRLERRL